MKKRILSIVLSIVMLVSLLPTTALAMETHSHYNCGVKNCEVAHNHSNVYSYTAWSGTGTPGGNVYLTDDITLTEELTISGTVNLCLNGHSITNSATAAIAVNSGATLNICDCKGGGSVTNSGGTNSSGTTYGIYNSGTVNVYGGTISATTTATTTTAGSGSGIYNYSGQVTVVGTGAVVSGTLYGIYNSSGTVSVSDGAVSGEYGIYNEGEVIVGGEIEVTGTDYGIYNSGTVTVSGGTVSGYTGINNSGTVNVSSNGTVQSTSSGGYGIENSGGTVTVSGGTVQATANNGQGIYNKNANGTVTVSGGTVQATGTNGKGICNYSGTVSVSDGSIVKGGSYGHGIYNSGGTVSVSGGSVTAIGVFNYGIENSSGTLKLSGAPTITGTTADVYLNNTLITISGVLTYTTEDKAISVKMNTPGTFTTGWTTNMGGNAANYGSYFTSANDGYTVQPDGNGELKLAEPPPHSHPICGATCTHEGEHNTLDSWTKLTASDVSDGTLSLTGGNSYYLGEDISVSASVEISGTVNLCLNGHTISAAGGYIDVSGTLNLCSCKDNGIIKRTTTTNALICADGGATANLYNVTLDGGAVWSEAEDTVLERGTTNSGITSSAPLIDAGGETPAGGFVVLMNCELRNNVCSGAGEGGAITVGRQGSLTATNTNVYNNAKTQGQAGAIKAYIGATVTLTGCALYGNEAVEHGGAIQIWGGNSSGNIVHMTMTDCTVRNNKAGKVGGAIAVSDYSKFVMSGGSIEYNATTDPSKRGGGVGFADANTEMAISGNAVISGNTAGGSSANNLYIGTKPCNKVTVGTMGSSANVGVTMANTTGVFTKGGADYYESFKSDNTAYTVMFNGDDLKIALHDDQSFRYTVSEDTFTQMCTCGHSKTATLEIDTSVSTVYNGSAIKALKVSYSDGWVGDQDAAISYSNNTNAGTASGSVTIGGLTVTKSFTISKATQEGFAITGKPTGDIAYGGSFTLSTTGGNGNGAVSWAVTEGNAYAEIDSTGKVTIEGVGEVTITATKAESTNYKATTDTYTFTSVKATPTYTVPANLTATYGQTLANVSLTNGWSWVNDSQSVGDVGTKTFVTVFTPTDTNNYNTVEAEVSVTVNAKQLTNPTLTLDESSFTYDGSAKTPTVIVKDGDTVLTVDTDYTVNYSDNTNAGTGKVTVTFKGNYSGNKTVEYAIVAADSSCTAPVAVDNLVYTGSAQNLVTAATPTGGTVQYSLSEMGTFSESIPTGTDAGTYNVYYKVIGDANHNDTAVLGPVQVKIAKQKVTMPTENTATFTYTGTAQTYMETASTLYEISNETQTNAGSYTVIVALKDSANYEWTDGTTTALEYIFKIEQKELGIAWSNTTLTYNGAAQQPTATATGVVTGEQIALVLGAPATNAGSYTATVHSIDGATAQNYKLPTNKSTSFTIEQQAITIVWGNGTFTYDSTEKFPAFNVEGIWNTDDVQVTKEGAQTNAGEYTAQIIGLTGTAADNYKLTGTLTKDFVINKADQAAPAVNKADETISGKNDGKITDVTANMEYRAEGEDHYTAIAGETVENLADGNYYVRVKGDSNHNPSADTVVVIGAGRMLTVTVPQNQVGYTMITTTPEVEYFGSIRVEFKLHDGYSMTDSFQICNGTDPVGFSLMGDTYVYGLNSVNSDFNFTVSGVADITAPLAQIDIKNNKWTSFWNGVTFGLFFNETQDVTVTAADTGSGMNSIQYYLAGGELELDEVKQIPVWQDYSSTFQIDPDNAYVVYVKVTDNAGNVSYLNSDGVVLDQTVPVLVGIENNGSYYGDQCFKALDDYLDALKVDGVDVTDEMNADNEYTIVADNAEHIVTATDKAGNATEYKITVFKNYTVTYKVDGNTVSTQTVGHGKDATAPTIPEKDGYTQTAPVWDKDGTNITADTEINAVYTINKYTVTYKADGQVVDTQTIEHGANATPPTVPAKEGYTQTAPAWDKDGTSITADTEINAVYTINKYTVTYVADGEAISTQTIEHGADATAPAVPKKVGYTQVAPYWDKDGKNITTDTEINAVYTINKYNVTFNSNGGNKVDGIPDVIHDTVITAPTAPTKENATFAGWFSDSACTKAWNFDMDTVTADLTLYAKWSDVPVFHISGKVLEKTGDGENDTGGVPNANVKLMLGTTLIATETTDENGLFYFGGQKAGDYNVVVTSGDKVVTVLVTLHDHDEDGLTVELPQTVTNSIVEHEPAADGKDSVAAGTLVGGLEDVAAAVRSENQSEQKVEVKLTVADQPPVTGTPTAGTEAAKQQAQQKAIQQKTGGKQLVFFDLSVVKTINDGTPVAITDTGDTLLEIRIPFDSGNKWGITIYRYHGDKAEVLAAVREGSTTEGFWVGDDGYIHIYTHKFSTYAVGYTVPSYGYFVPITPDTVTSADTFDAGIEVYVAMSMLAATGSAVVIGKKRKEN